MFFHFGNPILLDFGTAILVRYATILLGLGTEILVGSAHKYRVNSARTSAELNHTIGTRHHWDSFVELWLCLLQSQSREEC